MFYNDSVFPFKQPGETGEGKLIHFQQAPQCRWKDITQYSAHRHRGSFQLHIAVQPSTAPHVKYCVNAEDEETAIFTMDTT